MKLWMMTAAVVIMMVNGALVMLTVLMPIWFATLRLPSRLERPPWPVAHRLPHPLPRLSSENGQPPLRRRCVTGQVTTLIESHSTRPQALVRSGLAWNSFRLRTLPPARSRHQSRLGFAGSIEESGLAVGVPVPIGRVSIRGGSMAP